VYFVQFGCLWSSYRDKSCRCLYCCVFVRKTARPRMHATQAEQREGACGAGQERRRPRCSAGRRRPRSLRHLSGEPGCWCRQRRGTKVHAVAGKTNNRGCRRRTDSGTGDGVMSSRDRTVDRLLKKLLNGRNECLPLWKGNAEMF
jgi:hypothetical protein